MFKPHLIASACLVVLATPVLAQQATPDASAADKDKSGTVLETVVVTSQKRKEDARKVPLSVTAIGGEELQKSQIQDYSALTRNIPNVSFSSQGGPGLSTIEIRGISSQAGSATVGIYLDDVSLTTRNLYSQGTAEPRFFDINRVEVLRGPQGTLYGAGSMGGTIRFISNQPDLHTFSTDFHAEVSSTDHGGVNGMSQAVVNVPLQDGVAALRVGLQMGHDSGYINQVDPQTLGVIAKGINSDDWSVLKASVKIKFNDDWSLTPALFHQKDDTADIDAAYLAVGSYQQYNAGTTLPLYTTSKIMREPGGDELTVPSLTVNGDLGFADFTGTANSYKRNFVRTQDGTDVNSSYVGSLIANPTVSALVTYLPSAVYLDSTINQQSIELRLSSKDYQPGGMPLTWVAGFYDASTKTDVSDNEPIFGINQAFTSNGVSINDPTQWVSGSGIFTGAFLNDNSYFSARHYNDKQASVFGELTWNFSSSLRATFGLRSLQSTENFNREGNYFFAGGAVSNAGKITANKTTPRFALSWDVGANTSLYTNIAEGFRLGGVNRPIPLSISGNVSDLANLGLTAAPATFAPDSLWSYEVGSKSRLFGGSATLNLSAFHIDWKNTQQDVYLPTAGFDFETNTGNATVDGVEAELKARLTSDFTLDSSGGYNRAVFAEDVPDLGTDSTGAFNVRKGDPIQGVPKFNFHLGGEYRFDAWGHDSSLRLNAQWTGSSHGTIVRSNPDYLRPGYMTADGSWTLNFDKWDLNLFVKNLTNNHTILQQPNIQSVAEAYYLRPRTIGLGITGTF